MLELLCHKEHWWTVNRVKIFGYPQSKEFLLIIRKIVEWKHHDVLINVM